MDYLSSKALHNLRAAIRYSRGQVHDFRQNRHAAVREFVGKHYTAGGAADKVPLPLLPMAIRIYMRHLVSQNPAVMVNSLTDPALEPTAWGIEVDTNHLLKEIEFDNTMMSLALDAMFGMGLYKMGRDTTVGSVEVRGFKHDVRQLYVDTVDIDDAVWDVGAKRWDQIAYVGNKYRLPLEYVKTSGEFENVRNIQAIPRNPIDEAGEEHVEGISRGKQYDPDEFEDYTELWDIYLPRRNVMLTIGAHQSEDDEDAPPLREEEWTGPENGPYGTLGFGDVPSQILPLPPVALWIDVHNLANIIHRKLGRDAQNFKEVLGFSSSAAGDAERVVNAAHGDAVRVDDPRGMMVHRYGGIDQAMLAFLIQNKDVFSWIAGNLDSLGGLSAQAETLGQEELLSGSSSKTVEELQDRTTKKAQIIVKDLVWYRFYDPLAQRKMTVRDEKTGYNVPFEYSAKTREGDFLDYNIEIVPFSLQYMSPAAKGALMQRVWHQDILPMLPMMAQMGIMPDIEQYLRLLGRCVNLPEIEKMVRFSTPSMKEMMGQIGEQPRQSPVTERKYVRENRSAGTRQGTDKVLMQTLLGGGVQPAEAQAAFSS